MTILKHKYVPDPIWTVDLLIKAEEFLPRCRVCGLRPGHDHHYLADGSPF